MNLLIILLGSNILNIQISRLETCFKYIENNFYNTKNECIIQDINITWFLSGGIKNPDTDFISEASKMKSYIDKNFNKKSFNFVLDEKSTNTAENFIMASYYMNSTITIFDEIFIVTSDFHYNRANLMLNLIDPSKKYNWILSDIEESDSRYWETIHIKNVFTDVLHAKNILFNDI
jgi:hypothetical protein